MHAYSPPISISPASPGPQFLQAIGAQLMQVRQAHVARMRHEETTGEETAAPACDSDGGLLGADALTSQIFDVLVRLAAVSPRGRWHTREPSFL